MSTIFLGQTHLISLIYGQMIPQMKTYIFLLMFSFVAKCHQSMLTQFDPASGKTLWPGGAIMAPLVFSALGLPKAQN